MVIHTITVNGVEHALSPAERMLIWDLQYSKVWDYSQVRHWPHCEAKIWSTGKDGLQSEYCKHWLQIAVVAQAGCSKRAIIFKNMFKNVPVLLKQKAIFYTLQWKGNVFSSDKSFGRGSHLAVLACDSHSSLCPTFQKTEGANVAYSSQVTGEIMILMHQAGTVSSQSEAL